MAVSTVKVILHIAVRYIKITLYMTVRWAEFISIPNNTLIYKDNCY